MSPSGAEPGRREQRSIISNGVKVLNIETSFYVGQAFKPAYSKAKALPYVNFMAIYFLLSL